MRSESGCGSAVVMVALLGIGVAVRVWPFYALCVGLVLVAAGSAVALRWWLAVRRSARQRALQAAQDRARRVRESRQFAAKERAWSSAAFGSRDVPVPPRSWRTEQMN